MDIFDEVQVDQIEHVFCRHQILNLIFLQLSQLIKCLPGVFTNEHILQLCDLSNIYGRKVAAKALCQNSRFTSEETV